MNIKSYVYDTRYKYIENKQKLYGKRNNNNSIYNPNTKTYHKKTTVIYMIAKFML